MTEQMILLVEDDADLREALGDTLELAGFSYIAAEHAERALQILNSRPVALVISDVSMPGMDGHGLLECVLKDHAGVPVILMTAFGSVAGAVGAMRKGAADYLVKPFEPQLLVELAQRYVRGVLSSGDQVQPVAVDAASRELLGLARRVAAADATVLISGESGTGKEVLARYIHRQSARAEQPFVAINCAAIPEQMLEATLFGHEKGAFTGAIQSAPGKFEQANGGTILLDEISEMDLSLQAKLLRVLQEREVERVGGRRTIELDVRVLATTNRDLRAEVDAGRFREDLYYRLSVFPLRWMPLRDRPLDIVPLAEHLLHVHAAKMHRAVPAFTTRATELLTVHGWPGNVRELDNAVQRALIMQPGDQIDAHDLCLEMIPASRPESVASVRETAEAVGTELQQDVRMHEFRLIVDAIRGANGSRKRAAENLGLSPRTLRYKIARFREEGLDLDAALAA